MAKLTAEQKIERAHLNIMMDSSLCLYSGVIMIGDVKISDKVPTACTNGRDVIYGRAFIESLSDAEVMFIVLHEAMHKAYRHLSVYKHLRKERPDLINLATDYVINLEITDYAKHVKGSHSPRMPQDEDGNVIGLIDERFRNMDTTRVFNILKKEIPEQPTGGSPTKGEDGEDGEGGEGGESGEGNDIPQSHDDHDWDGAQELSDEEKEALQEEIEQALREGSQLVGKRAGKMSVGIEDALTPKVNWRDALRDEVKEVMSGQDDSTWRKPNKKYLAIDVMMPSTFSERVGILLTAEDSSGSTYDIRGQFRGEIQLIGQEVRPRETHLLYWDTVVENHEVYKDDELSTYADFTKPMGGGGTDPDCVPDYLGEKNLKPEIIIMLTDGYLSCDVSRWSQVTCPVIWCVVNNKRFTAPIGKTIHIDTGDM